ncbi:outer membrane protein assembly factor BamD, partial [Massilia cavernae]
MQKKLKVVVASFLLLGMSACSLMPEKTDQAKNWSVEKLYAEA